MKYVGQDVGKHKCVAAVKDMEGRISAEFAFRACVFQGLVRIRS